MLAVLLILLVVLALVMALSMFGAGPSWVRRRTVVYRPRARRRVVAEPVERVVEEPVERVVERPAARRTDIDE